MGKEKEGGGLVIQQPEQKTEAVILTGNAYRNLIEAVRSDFSKKQYTYILITYSNHNAHFKVFRYIENISSFLYIKSSHFMHY